MWQQLADAVLAGRTPTRDEARVVLHAPEDELLADLGLEKKDGPYTFYRETKNGCKNCTHTGFKGRRGIFELLPLSAGVREQIIRRGACDRIGEEAVRAGFRTMRQHGVELIVNGETTAEEVLRVTTKAENV